MTAVPLPPEPAPELSSIVVPDLAEGVDALTAALAYAKGGINVGPIRHGSKNPGSVLDSGNRRSDVETWRTRTTTDSQVIVGWYAGQPSQGVFLHALGMVIFDVDRPAAVPDWMWKYLDAMPFQRSRRGGDPRKGHYLAACPPGRQFGNSLGKLPKGWGEIRGVGGVIVAAPTRHEFAAEDGYYHWVRTGPVPILAAEIADQLPDAVAGERMADDEEVKAFLVGNKASVKPWLVDEVLRRFAAEAAVDSRHGAALSAVCWITRESAAGVYAAQPALERLFLDFSALIGKDRPAKPEFRRIIAWAIGQLTPERLAQVRAEHGLPPVPGEASAAPQPPKPAPMADVLPMNREAMTDHASAPAQHQLDDQPPLAAWDTPPDDGPSERTDEDIERALLEHDARIELRKLRARQMAVDLKEQEDRGLSDDDGQERRASWERTDLTGFVNGDYEAPTPTLMPREDGICLLYPGLVHSFHGESESGKSWVMQAEAARCIQAGLAVLYVDFESDAGAVTDRLLELGCSPEAILAHFDYRSPEARPTSRYEIEAWRDMLSHSYVLAVIDGVTDSLNIWGAKSNDGDEVTGWMRAFPKQLAVRTGAAVSLIDHVIKNVESRGRFATGSQMKMAGLTGAAYTVEVDAPLGRGLRGSLLIRVGKDRPGNVRGHGGEMRKVDRTQLVAQFVLDSTGKRPEASLVVPDESPRVFRPTALMERVSAFLAASPGATGRSVSDSVQGKGTYIRTALTLLISEGYVSAETAGRGVRHRVLKPYTEATDPLCVHASLVRPNASQDALPSMRPASPSPLGGTHTEALPGPASGAPMRPSSSRAVDDCVSCGKPCETTFDDLLIHPTCPPPMSARESA